MKENGSAVILFDGVCNLCNGFVQFVIKRDKTARFRFASLQSSVAREILATHGDDPNELRSVKLVENGSVYSESTAALRILKKLDGAWKLLYVLIIIPVPLRNFVYRLIANHRYRWFGRRESCMLPTKELRSRFLDAEQTTGGNSRA